MGFFYFLHTFAVGYCWALTMMTMTSAWLRKVTMSAWLRKVTMSAWLWKVTMSAWLRKVAEGCGRLQLRCIVIGLEVTKQKTKWIQRCECKARC